MSIFSSLLVIGSLATLAVGCGLIDPKFEDYEGDSDSDGGGGLVDVSTECGQTALAAFDANIKSAVDGTCAVAGCHASGAGAAELLMVNGDSQTNRVNIFSFTGFDRSKLTNYIGGGTHGGGDKSSSLPVNQVTAWLDVEEGCTSQGVVGPEQDPGHRPGGRSHYY